jgi:hypothetical protein
MQMNTEIRCAIRVRGHLTTQWLEYQDDLVVTNLDGGETQLAGVLADQSRLLGLINRLHAMNLTLLALDCSVLPAQADSTPATVDKG